jgi:hypothetical protein
MVSEDQKQLAEEEILAKQRIVDYDTKEYPVETIVEKYTKGIDEGENEIFVPDYQRDFAWDIRRQSKFIESVIIGLPIPYVFVADAPENEGRLEIVDGSQRIRTLAAFMQDNLILTDLKKLEKLNGFKYSDLPLSRQRRFNRRTIRMIELTEKADEEVRRDIFERINTGSEELSEMEKRRGIIEGPFIEFLTECATIPKLAALAPLSEASLRRREREEFVLRFFAYLANYQRFDRQVNEFLNQYINSVKDTFDDSTKNEMKSEFQRVLDFVEQYFPHGFKKNANNSRTPRIRFEAIAVGAALALRKNLNLVPKNVETWLSSPEFKDFTTSDASNSRPKIIKRIEYVRDMLLGRAPAIVEE